MIFFFFSPFPLLSFPFLFSFLGQSTTIQLMDAPSPVITSPLISLTLQGRKHFRANHPLQRGPGTMASTNKYPKSPRLQQTNGVLLHRHSQPGKCCKKCPICCLVISIFYVGSTIHTGAVSPLSREFLISRQPRSSSCCCCSSPPSSPHDQVKR